MPNTSEDIFENFKEKIEKQIAGFKTISLSEMDSVKLMDRVDVKFVIPLPILPQILQKAQSHYQILSIENKLLAPYETLYYDTENLDLYHRHQAGKLNRHKVRFRKYINTGASYFELKFKNNKRRTLKTRIATTLNADNEINTESSEFLKEENQLTVSELHAKIWVNYLRLTLVNLQTSERITMDFNLTFKNENLEKKYEKVVIVEVKQSKTRQSAITEIFREFNLKQGSISKYCLGIMSLYPTVKHNRFKRKFLHLNNVIQQYEHLTNNN
jgi:VTC domain